MNDDKRKPGRPPGRRVQPFNTVLPPEAREYLAELSQAWNMPQNQVIVRLIRYAKFGEPLPKSDDTESHLYAA